MITESRLREIIRESLRDWFKKEDWVKINTAGTIEGPCGTMDKKEPTQRCLPRKKAERAATARKKVRGSRKGKQFVKNTRKGKFKKKS
jgi:hypothetical protein